jgi:hypothetical protein
MSDQPRAGIFAWYDESVRGACPPKSLFIVLLAVTGILVLPAVGLWVRELYAALAVLLSSVLILLACLCFDLFSTLRRYRAWHEEWLCGECRSNFVPREPAAINSSLY